MDISKRVQKIPPSGIREFFDLVIGMKDIISLGVGEPDFSTPWHITDSAIHSLEQGLTSYTSNKGLIELRKAISLFLRQSYGIDYDPEEEVLVTVGVSEAMDLTFRALLNPGDKVLVADPHYVAYGPLVELAGGKAVYLQTSGKSGFKVTPQVIEQNIDKKTRALVLNYPTNPTGTSYTKAELERIKRVCIKHDLVIVTDEVYDQLTYDFDHTPFPSLKGAKPRTVYLNGFSKTYAMTGWRIGFACGPREIIAGMTKIHQYTIMSAPTMGQVAALEAITNGKRQMVAMKQEYARRRTFVIKSLCAMGLTCHMPQGAFYAYPSIACTGMDSVTFAKQLLTKEKVALVPGVAFSAQGKDYVRISYASSMENLTEAMRRIKRFLTKQQRR